MAPPSGGRPITAYRVVFETRGVSTTDQTLTIDQLLVDANGIHWSVEMPLSKAGGSFRAQVAAVNAKGEGPLSPFSDWYTPVP